MGFLQLARNRARIIAGLGRYHRTGRRRPIFAHLILTNRCNMKCRYCFVDVNSDIQSDLTLDEWRQTLDGLHRRGCISVTFMGGEPLLFDGVDALIDHAKGLGLNLDMITNGIGVEKHAAALAKLDAVMVSLDGPPEANAVNRGKNAFRVTLEAIEFFKKIGVPVRINCMANRQSRDAIPWMLDFARTHRVPITFNLLATFPPGRRELEEEIMLTREEAKDYYRTLLHLKRTDPERGRYILFSESALRHVIDYPLPYREVIWRRPGEVLDPRETCLFGQVWVHIDSNGDIYPCSTLWNIPERFQPGNLRSHGLDAALARSADLPCRSCFWPAPLEWRRMLTPRGMLDGLRITVTQVIGQRFTRRPTPP
ncbi:MAG: radical SAM protein [Magnetococcales bacterium]|nr:radical SAM protein [Magnetococcales bacterium]